MLGVLSFGAAAASLVAAAAGVRLLGMFLALGAVGTAAADVALSRRGGGTVSGAGAAGLLGGLVSLVVALPLAGVLEARLVERAGGQFGGDLPGALPVVPVDPPEPRLLVPATVSASSTAPTAADVTGETVDFAATNAVDGDLSTAWRTFGAGEGEALVFTFSGPVRLEQIGVVPGYAKVDPDDGAQLFWFYRRVLAATYEFDDGQQLVVEFDEDPAGTSHDVDTTTTSVTMLIERTTTAPLGDFTAISEIQFVGTPS